jgi:hypothetical protein
MIHTGISTGCNACHDTNYVWKGMDLYPILPSSITTNGSYKGFQTRPIAAPATTSLGKFGITDSAHPLTGDCSQCHSSTTAFTGVALPSGHMPTTVSTCSTCHSATDYSVAGLIKTGIHTGITGGMVTYTAATIAVTGDKTCKNCHTVGLGGTSKQAPFTGCLTSTNCASPPPVNAYQPMLKESVKHVPIGITDCNGCHASFTSFGLMNMKPGSKVPHDNVALGGVTKCLQCHELGMAWDKLPSPLKVRVANKHQSTAEKTQDCIQCHSTGGFNNNRALARPIMREALVNPNTARPTVQTGRVTRGSLGNSFDHKGVEVGKCKTCHDGKAASGMPARHLMVATSCDTCHRPTSWLPAQFNHSGVSPNTCQACHNGVSASAKPAGHFMTPRSCDTCHKNTGWAPVSYTHTSPSYKFDPEKLTCVSCHETNGEMIRRQLRGLTRAKPRAVGP